MKTKKILTDMLVVTIGCVLMGLSVSLFFDPYRIIPGGLTGLSILLHDATGLLSIGSIILIVNIPLFLLSWIFVGHHFLIGTVFGTVVSSLFIDLFNAVLKPPTNLEPFMAAIAGAVLMGLGLGLIFTRGYTSGGSDVAARLLKNLMPHVQMGHLMLVIDCLVIAAAGLYYQDLNSVIVAAVAVYIISVVVNGVVYGINVERVAYIISSDPDKVVAAIENDLHRGATLLHGEGGFRGEPRKVILCAIKRQQSAALKMTVKKADPHAFLIVMSANEVLGEGFRDYDEKAM